MSVNPPEPPALQSVQSADALYGRVITRGRRLRRERWAFLATAGTAVVLLAAAVPIALSSDGGERVATTDRPHTTRPAPTTTSTTAPLTTEPGVLRETTTTLAPVAVDDTVPVRTTTTRRPTATTAPRSTVTTRPAATTTTQPPAPTTTVPSTGAATNCTETQPLVASGPSGVVFVRNGDIWSSTGDEATATNLTATPDDTEQAPAYSPDRTRIVFVRSGGLFVMPATGGVVSPLTEVFSGDSAPAWSRDGGLIAFVRGGDIWLVNPNDPTPGGGPTTRAIDVADPLGNPTWSPDGCRLAFTWRGAVLTARTDGTGMVKVRDAVAEPSWGLNGRIAVSAVQGTTRDVFTVLPDASGFERLTTGGASNPVWSSANDNVVAFQSGRTGNGDIYTISYPSPPGAIARITSDAAPDTDPTW
jgi:hypothetical protein